MTDLKKQAMKIIEQIPEENMKYVLKKLSDMQEELKPVDEEELEKSIAAYEELHKILKRNNVHVPKDFDYKDEVAKEVMRKYESIA